MGCCRLRQRLIPYITVSARGSSASLRFLDRAGSSEIRSGPSALCPSALRPVFIHRVLGGDHLAASSPSCPVGERSQLYLSLGCFIVGPTGEGGGHGLHPALARSAATVPSGVNHGILRCHHIYGEHTHGLESASSVHTTIIKFSGQSCKN